MCVAFPWGSFRFGEECVTTGQFLLAARPTIAVWGGHWLKPESKSQSLSNRIWELGLERGDLCWQQKPRLSNRPLRRNNHVGHHLFRNPAVELGLRSRILRVGGQP